MFSVVMILVVTFVSLTVLLWVGSFYFQGYIYTEPSQQLFWQAPAAALFITFGYSIWCFSIVFSKVASPDYLPVDTLFRFSPTEDLLERPAQKLWAIRRDRLRSAGETKDGDMVLYESKRDNQTQFHYVDATLAHRPWQAQDVIAIEIEKADGSKMRFNPAPVGPGEYRKYVSADGWLMQEYETGPTGLPIKFNMMRLIWNVIFNAAHFAGWFLGLWVILRFQWSHAFGFALILWAIATLTILPMMLTHCGSVAHARHLAMAALGTWLPALA